MTIISSLRAKCKDCHRCIRACPVKAISLRNGQAQVIQERCVTCGLCVTICPQGAKTVQTDIHRITAWRKSNVTMVASLAPSFPAAFPHLDPLQVISGLKALGFAAVEETAQAATSVAQHYHAAVLAAKDNFVISSCCPVVVNIVEMYYPELIPNLAATVSPMILHGLKLKRKYPDAKVVFIGPCSGKIAEATRLSSDNAIDAVITFRQLQDYWQKNNLDPSLLLPALLEELAPASRLYPLGRGILESSLLPTGPARTMLSISGIENCLDTFRDLSKGILKPTFVEALACREGCVGGTEVPSSASVMTRKEAVVLYHERCSKVATAALEESATVWEVPPYSCSSRIPPSKILTEEQIHEVLRAIGKDTVEDERNCGGCGYETCRDKDIATLQGFAELEMCVPFMRAKFESLSHLVVDSSPNGVIVVNDDLTIHQFNAEAERMFNPSGSSTKKAHLSMFLDPVDFMEVVATGKVVYKRVEYSELKMVTRQVIYALPEYDLVVGIITDITEEEVHKKKLEARHQETIQRATAVIRNQMKLAQEIAGLLGEATAETKATLLELITSLTDGGTGSA